MILTRTDLARSRCLPGCLCLASRLLSLSLSLMDAGYEIVKLHSLSLSLSVSERHIPLHSAEEEEEEEEEKEEKLLQEAETLMVQVFCSPEVARSRVHR